MKTGRPTEPSGRLIRRFSDGISDSSPGEPLSRALAAKVAVDRNQERSVSLRTGWDQLLLQGRQLAQNSMPDEEAVLLQQSQRLHAAWSKFRDSLPENQQLPLGDRDRPDIQFLVASVSKAPASWQSGRDDTKLGKLKSKFHNLCETCNSHSALLSVLPKDDKYVTLLTGSLSAIAQATINHQKIAEGVADTLDDLSQDIDFWNRQMTEHGNIPALRQYIQELYVIVFEFFTEIFTKWSISGWKRFLTSFDQDAFNKLFKSKKDRMLTIERRMENFINLDFRHRTTRSLEMMIQNQERLYQILPDQLREQRLFLGESLQRFLEQQRFSRVEPPQPCPIISIAEDTAGEVSSASSSSGDETLQPRLEVHSISQARYRFSRADIQAAINCTTQRWKDQVDQLIRITNQASLLQLDREVHTRLVAWLRASNSTNFWIQGPHDISQPSQNSMTAVALAALARNNNLPCFIYFSSFTEHHQSEISKNKELGLFLASIITQLVQLIPDNGYSEADLSPARFASLEQGNLSVADAIHLIRDVRNVGPRLAYGFIDNIQVLEDRSNEKYNRELLSVIATICRLGRGPRRSDDEIVLDKDEAMLGTRICFTTDGYVDGLAQAAELQLLDKVAFDLETSDPLSSEIGGILGWDREGTDE
ncbi:hypothetical protein N7462_001360 [Penicillium macrosclerotiorum]|uniref:uncharacterized protein n=1 Tax=Penicillium macrosclerotiorum TaxID=303699 RepID=UPI0025470D41|nr:uncharacterized protein N7462_001360 [Penicillium macrosclerotiorum]KAJ5691937.1 hypothetical protein N7462_001360 [Penicillium macrosclerotiorum]